LKDAAMAASRDIVLSRILLLKAIMYRQGNR